MLGGAQQQQQGMPYSKPPPLRPARVRRHRKVNKEVTPKTTPSTNGEPTAQLVIDVPAQREEVGERGQLEDQFFLIQKAHTISN